MIHEPRRHVVMNVIIADEYESKRVRLSYLMKLESNDLASGGVGVGNPTTVEASRSRLAMPRQLEERALNSG